MKKSKHHINVKFIKSIIEEADRRPGFFYSANKLFYRELISMARELRGNPTIAEKLLWNRIRKKQLGTKFRRQHIISRFIVDFCSLESSLIIELDGRIHNFRISADEERTIILENEGYKILRFKNLEVLYDIDYVINKIKGIIN